MTRQSKTSSPDAAVPTRAEIDALTDHVLGIEEVALAMTLAASRLAFTGEGQERVAGQLSMVAVAGYLAGIAGARRIAAFATTIDSDVPITVERGAADDILLVQGGPRVGGQREVRFNARYANAVAGAMLRVAAEIVGPTP